jgi:hypothetical protein
MIKKLKSGQESAIGCRAIDDDEDEVVDNDDDDDDDEDEDI